jgi:hypothetical protein
MQFLLTPKYKDLFDDSPPTIDNVVESVKVDTIIKVVSYINAQLYLNLSNENMQNYLLNTWLTDQGEVTRLKIDYRYRAFKNDDREKIGLFSPHYILGFLHECLSKHEEEFDKNELIDISPEAQLLLFKAYVHYINEYNKKINIKNVPNENFQERTWSLMVGQSTINEKLNYFNTMIKSMCFFDFFEFEVDLKNHVDQFLLNTGCENGKNYAFRNIKLMQDGTNARKGSNNDREHLFNSTEEMIPMYDRMSINFSNYQTEHKNSDNLTGIRKFPLYKVGTNVYYVIDWNLFARKMYSGLIFDFYERSGIKREIKGDFINHYKPLVSKMVEKHLFRKLIQSIFSGSKAEVKFDDEEMDGAPDAYVRIGKRVFLFEIKDALFSAKAIESKEYKEIKGVIDEKYNSRKKGTGQILNQMEYLKNSTYEEKSFDDLKIKHRNLVIYPVIVYTDPNFGVLGMESYLNDEFEQKAKSKGFDEVYGTIRRLAFINLDFFIERLVYLRKPQFRLDKLMDSYEKKLKVYEKRFGKSELMADHFLSHSTFEDVSFKGIPFNKNGTNYIQQIFDDLDLMRGLDPE